MKILIKKTHLFLTVAFLALSVSCKKDPSHLPIEERDVLFTGFSSPLILSNANTKPLLDLDRDGVNDLAFRLTVVSENSSTEYYYLAEPLNENVQLVATALLDAYSFSANTEISDISQMSELKRWSGSLGTLLEKYIGQSETNRAGTFRGANKSYLGVRIKKGAKFHYGWVEISHDLNSEADQVIISGAGFCKLPERSIQAGYH